jgi:serine/threonine protein kinase
MSGDPQITEVAVPNELAGIPNGYVSALPHHPINIVPSGYVSGLPFPAAAAAAVENPHVVNDDALFYSPSDDNLTIVKTYHNRFVLPDGTPFNIFTSTKAYEAAPHIQYNGGSYSTVYKLNFGGAAAVLSFILKVITRGPPRTIQKEIEKLVMLKGHAIAVQLIAAIVNPVGNSFILYPYVPGQLLESMLLLDGLITSDYNPNVDAGKRIGPARQAEYFHIYNRLIMATRRLHELGIVHHDIKPENIWIQDNLEPLFLDFGLSETIGSLGIAKGSRGFVDLSRWDTAPAAGAGAGAALRTPIPVTADINWYALGKTFEYFDPTERHKHFLKPRITNAEASQIRFEGGASKSRRTTYRNRKQKQQKQKQNKSMKQTKSLKKIDKVFRN